MMRHKMLFRTILLAGAMALAAPYAATAQQAGGIRMDSSQPIEVSADDSFEWRTQEKKYIAHGNAIAKQGDVELICETLTADYRDKANGGTEVWKLTAAGSVMIRSPGQTAYGDLATYELDHGVAVLTGDNLRIVTADDKVTARDSIEYYANDNRLIARGNAVATRGDDRLESDVLIAHFSEGEDGKTALDRLVAPGKVTITTPTDIVWGNSGVYDIATERAVLEGDVGLMRGINTLNGQRAEINLKTGSSRLFSGSKKGRAERVKGVFYPEKAKQPESSPAESSEESSEESSNEDAPAEQTIN